MVGTYCINDHIYESYPTLYTYNFICKVDCDQSNTLTFILRCVSMVTIHSSYLFVINVIAKFLHTLLFLHLITHNVQRVGNRDLEFSLVKYIAGLKCERRGDHT